MDSKFPNSRDEKHDCFAFFLVPTLKCLHCREGFQTVKKISPPVCCVAQYQVLRYINTIFHQGCTDLILPTMDAQLSSCINLCSAETTLILRWLSATLRSFGFLMWHAAAKRVKWDLLPVPKSLSILAQQTFSQC